MAVSPTRALGAALLAGLIAGALAAVIELGVAEPMIDRAIAIERQAHAAHGEAAEPAIVTRATQRKGLVVGLVLYGVIWGALVSVVYTLVDGRRGLWDPATRGGPVTLAVGWAVAWFPFLKYPANPPGVGEHATLAHRELLYVAFLALSAAGAAIAFIVSRWRAGRGAQRSRSASWRGVILYAVYAVVLYVAMPGDPDPVRMPSALVWRFRSISLAGLVVLWVSMAIVFDWLLRRRASRFGGRMA